MKARFDFSTDGEYEEYLRHYFAGQALMGICAHPDTWGKDSFEKIARAAIEAADALLAELAKPEQP